MVEFRQKANYTVSDLVGIVRLLRSPGGCPWDREQDHHSIRKNLIEETYEVAEAIDLGDAELLREELGDLLLQVALHARMEQEAGRFDFDDVCDGICKKLIERHPHVFGDTAVNGVGDVLTNWEHIKQRSKGQTTATETLESVPKTLPALMRAQKVGQRAAKAGFTGPDWMREMREQAESRNLGGVLFAAAQAARASGVDAEETLTAATEDYVARFGRMEQLARQRGLDMKNAGADALDACWRDAEES